MSVRSGHRQNTPGWFYSPSPQSFPRAWQQALARAYHGGALSFEDRDVLPAELGTCFAIVGMAPADATLGAGSTAWAPVATAIADALKVAPRAEVHAFVRALIQQTIDAARTGSALGPVEKVASATYARALLAAYP